MLVVCLFVQPLQAQIETGNISGLVIDQTGGALPGVTVTVVNLATGRERVVVTNETGLYRVAGLQPSRYSVKAELQGFATVTRPEITVNVGATVDVHLTLGVEALQETVTVTGQAPLVESTRTDLSNVITQEDLESLPSKNREYLDFTLLMPAATESSQQQGTGAVVGAARAKEGTLLVDGFYNLDEVFSMPKTRHSQDSIQEFQVVTFGGEAEYGRAIGGTINAITKSGGNEFNGSGYGFFRHKDMNAQDFGERARGVPKSEFSRRQWGGSFGGPLKLNRSFFFTAFERTTEDIPYDNGIRPEDGAAIGLPAEDVGTVPRFLRRKFAMGKWDHNVNDNHRVQVAYTYSTEVDRLWSTIEPLTTRSAASSHLNFWDHSIMAKWTAVGRQGGQLHELKLAYMPRQYRPGGFAHGGPPLVPDGQINLGNMSNASPPRVSIANVATFGSQGFQGDNMTHPIHGIYGATFFTDKHQIKAGVDYLFAHQEWAFYSSLRGSYSFASLANFLAGRYNTFSQTFGDVSNPRTHQYISGFAQDTWQLNRRLTLNYGLRYDLELNPEHKLSGIKFPNDYNNVGPRLAAAFDLTDKGTTFLKVTSGVYYDRLWQNMTGFFTSLKGHEQTTSATWTPATPGAPVYPNVFADGPPAFLPQGVRNASIMPDDVRIPTNAQVVGTLEHMLRPDLAISGSVIYSRAWYKEYTYDTNLEWDGQRWFRPDPTYRSISQLRFGGPAEYTGGFVQVTKRGRRFGYEGNITFARSYQTPTTASGISGTIDDQFLGIMNDYGPAPDVAKVRGLVSAWFNIRPTTQISGIFRARSGGAVDPRALGLDLNGDQKFGDRTPGLKSHSFRGPAMKMLDVRFTQMLPFMQDNRLHFYVESFNVLNTKNVRSVLNNYGPDPNNPHPRWLEPAGYFPPREVQLGLRVTF
ncbi:MAG: TonB-dependent receptor [Vicinamibacterales bacterium]